MRLSTALLALGLTSAPVAFLGAALAAEPVFPPGSRIGLVPPGDMKPARGLAGFRNPSTGAAILAVEMPPDAYPGLVASFSDEALKAQGFSLAERGTVPVGSGKAILISGQQNENGRTVPKTLLLASDPSMTALVVGQLPSNATAADTASIRAAMKTVAFRPPLALDEQIAALPFSVADRAGFRVVRAMAGNSLLMTEGPDDVIKSASQPVLILAQSFAPGPNGVAARDAFARQALASSNFFRDTLVERSQPFRQDGTEWHEIVAKAVETGSGVPVVVMQTIRFESDSYLRAVGIVKAGDRDQVLSRFRKIVDGLVEK